MNHRKVNEMYNGNILYGKKWTVCGDSFSHGDFTGLPEEEWYLTEGRYKGQMRVYPYFIGNRNDMEIVNLAINGETLALAGDGEELLLCEVDLPGAKKTRAQKPYTSLRRPELYC